MRFHKLAAPFLAAALISISGSPSLGAQSADRDQFRKALSMYERGLYSEARTMFSSMAPDAQTEGYAVLCAATLRSEGYETMISDYLEKYPHSGLAPLIHYRYGLNLFDDEEYRRSGEEFSLFRVNDLPADYAVEYLFKSAYSDFGTGDYDAAIHGFEKVMAKPHSDFTAPSQYATGYIWYEREKFSEALDWFGKSVKDPRFEEMSNYYIMECHFMMKDYDYVTAHGADMYGRVPEERKPHLARLISEAYLVKGDATTARKYYDEIRDVPGKERGDYFYAGSLLYATKDYQGAIDNYSKMTSRADSIGQVANYHMGYSYIQTHNKVAALSAFKDAAQARYDTAMQEDAFFNWAKLAFDINTDSSVFDEYIAKYSDKVKGQQIYSYQAVAALYNHDYAAAVAAYDNIDELDRDMVGNYMKANYLRANQLVRSGSYRSAVPCLKAAAYYSDKHSPFNQLARYWLAESYYRDDQFSQARSLFNELHNLSALEGKTEGKLIPYNIAYCYFKEGNYDMAAKWFDEYSADSKALNRKDAMVRSGDSRFIRKDYKGAVEQYNAVINDYPALDDLYPYYQAGLSYGLSNNLNKKIEVLSNVEKAKNTVPFYGESLFELGRAYVDAKKEDKAMECYSRITRDSKDSVLISRALIGMGMVSRNRAKYDEALTYYKKVVEKMPSSPYAEDALLAIESIYQTRQEPEKYLAYVETLDPEKVKIEGNPEDMLFNAAEQIFLAENYQKAIVSLEAYIDKYPSGRFVSKADFYMAESLRLLGKKDQACDYYRIVMGSGDASFAEISALNFANLSYSLEKWSDAFEGYEKLLSIARMDVNKLTAKAGMMRAASNLKANTDAIHWADEVIIDTKSGADLKREADYIKAKAYLASSDRSNAFSLFRKLAKSPKTAEGAEATYLLIQDSYDSGEYQAVEDQVFAFADSGSSHNYWLAKSFILLGDSYVDQEDYEQARATFESVRDGYKSTGDSDDVLDNVNMRLQKLTQMGK
ncbi:MAG: tetratricopeptide repeat protein [Bacteroidales bacterium]|nr:tetratricopeptide repeat protein [Bacteroidales bacterium]